MTTLYTHAIAGLGLGALCAHRRMGWPYWVLAGFLPIVPDFDVFSNATYGAPFGHRGFTHSFVFAAWLALLAASVTFRYLRSSFWWLTLFYFAVLASHGLLDACTRGGAPILFFWPLDVRYGNWGPIPVADIGFQLPDPSRSRAVRAEMLWVWLPTVSLVALVWTVRWLRRRRGKAHASDPGQPGTEGVRG